MSRRLLQPCLVATLAAALAGLSAPMAHAYVAAKIDEQIRPNFGILLKPSLKRRHEHRGPWHGRRWGYRIDFPYPPPGPYLPPYGRPRLEDSVTVDCADAPPGATPISDAATWVRDGGVVYVRAHGVACTETIEIEHPVVIAGEETSAFSTDPAAGGVVISPADGQPCVLVAQGVPQVELRGLSFVAAKAGQASCIQAWDSQVAIVRTAIDYAGDGSAIYVSGGRLIVRESRIAAHTYDAAVLTEGAGVDMYKVRVRAETTGLDLTLGAVESHIERVGVLDDRTSGPGTVGVVVRAQRSGGGLLKINNSVVCGYRVGVGLERAARVELRRTRLCRAAYGVMATYADLDVTESAIGADRVGVYVAGGQARITRNRIYGLDSARNAVVSEEGAGVVYEPNWYYLRSGCDRFDWNGREYCRGADDIPPSLRDESGFDRDYADGWPVDGYEEGYMRDGAVGPFQQPPKRRRFGVFHDR